MLTNVREGLVKMTDETPKKETKPKDPNALPNKVTCSKCKKIWGVRHIVYAKRVAKLGAAKGIAVPEVTDDNLETIKSDANFIKARQLLDQTYVCRVCNKVVKDAEKAEKAKAKTNGKADDE